MVVTVKCPSCGTSLKLQEAFTKSIQEFKCLKCGAMIPLGSSAGAAAGDAASPAGAPAAPRPGAGGRTGVFKTISTACSGCKRPMNLPPALAGKKIRCKDCGTVFQVPAVSSGAPVGAPAAPAVPPPAAPASEPKTIVLPVEAVGQPPVLPAVVPPPPVAVPAEVPAAAVAAPAGQGEVSPADALRRAETAEAALRVLAGQYAVEKAGLLHEIEMLKAKGSATPSSLAAE
ncbi:MAG: hypothetical protein KJ579_04800, partial [Verrucomicrobia bacterium]|nr:hypothetical protein [Verrucomicrobiota bacterium]